MDREQIIGAIEAYSRETGLAPSTITGRAVKNSRLYSRMKRGGDCTTKVARRIETFIAKSKDEGAA